MTYTSRLVSSMIQNDSTRNAWDDDVRMGENSTSREKNRIICELSGRTECLFLPA